MTQCFGEKSQLAVEVGGRDSENRTLMAINIWAENWNCNPNDNLAYLPAFSHSLMSDIERLRSSSFFRMDLASYSHDGIYDILNSEYDPYVFLRYHHCLGAPIFCFCELPTFSGIFYRLPPYLAEIYGTSAEAIRSIGISRNLLLQRLEELQNFVNMVE
jgi:hypothetical protein